MSDYPPPGSHLDDIRELLVDFGLPALVIVITSALLWTGKDGEVKAIMTLAAGWIFKSGYTKATK